MLFCVQILLSFTQTIINWSVLCFRFVVCSFFSNWTQKKQWKDNKNQNKRFAYSFFFVCGRKPKQNLSESWRFHDRMKSIHSRMFHISRIFWRKIFNPNSKIILNCTSKATLWVSEVENDSFCGFVFVILLAQTIGALLNSTNVVLQQTWVPILL